MADAGDDWRSGYVTDLLYHGEFHRELAPVGLSMASRWAGADAPDAAAPYTYLELGCGQGTTLNLLAASNGHGEFYGNDFNPAHIVAARAGAEAAGLKNVNYLDCSFGELLDPEHLEGLPDFDYIALHGVYAWVASEVRDEIVAVIARKLKPGGLVFLDYNCSVGWAPMAPMQRLAYVTAGRDPQPMAGRVRAAFDLQVSLRDAGAWVFDRNPNLGKWLDRVRDYESSYLSHEYLNGCWTPLCCVDVMAEMRAARLTYVGHPFMIEHFEEMVVKPEARSILDALDDRDMRELAKDFLVNRTFRSEIYGRGARALSPAAQQGHLLSHRFVLRRHRTACVLARVVVPAGTCALPERVHGPVLDALSEGAQTGASLLARPELAALGQTEVLRSLGILCGLNHVAAALPEAGYAARKAVADRYNDAALAQARTRRGTTWLASPVLGAALPLGPFDALFLGGHRQGVEDLGAFAWAALKDRGERLVRDDEPVASDEENLTIIRERAARFLVDDLRMLESFGMGTT